LSEKAVRCVLARYRAGGFRQTPGRYSMAKTAKELREDLKNKIALTKRRADERIALLKESYAAKLAKCAG